MTRTMRVAVSIALVGLLVASVGCRRVAIDRDANVRTTEETVELGGAKSAEVNIEMGAGTFDLSGGAATGEVLSGSFTYAPSSLRPVVDSSTRGDVVEARVRFPERPGINLGGNMRSEWDIALGDEVPIDLNVRLGAGESNIDLSEVPLSDFTLGMGAGETTVDLSGPRAEDLKADITAGVGQLIIKLPRDVGVRVKGHRDGIGEFDADGLRNDGDYLVNDAWGTAKTGIDLNVQRGVGEVRLELTD